MFVDPSYVVLACIGICIAAWSLTNMFVNRFLKPATVEIVIFDYQTFRGDIYLFPMPVFKTFASKGHSLPFSWGASNRQFYFARNIDFEKQIIDFGWPHKIRIEEAAVILASLQAREDDYARLKKENIIIRRYPKVVGAEIALRANNAILSDIDDALYLGKFDVDEYLKEVMSIDLSSDNDSAEEKEEENKEDDSDVRTE